MKTSIALLVVTLVSIPVLALQTDSCECQLRQLKELESLEKSWRRLRVENPNGLTKYPTTNDSLIVGCQTLAVYEKTVYSDSTNTTWFKLKRCRECSKNGEWSGLNPCAVLRCDRDDLSGAPIFKLAYSEIAPPQQALFLPDQVFAIYPGRKCRECLANGDWSSKNNFSCFQKKITTPKPPQSCNLDELIRMEYLQFNYVRLRIESPDGLWKIVEDEVTNRRLPANTVVVYQRYLSLLANIQLDAAGGGATTPNPFKQVNLFTRKFCRYCDAASGKWSEMESCVSLGCDPSQLTGSPDFLFASNLTSINRSPNMLFKPFTVSAVYSYGSEKTCKQCHENGEWSKYSATELCSLRGSNGGAYIRNEATRTGANAVQRKKETPPLNELYRKEEACWFSDLKSIENLNFSNWTRTLLVSPDRRRKLDPLESDNVKFPSRSLSIYSNGSGEKACTICLNGLWTTSESLCRHIYSRNLEFCQRNELETDSKFQLDNGLEAPFSQNLFEPGSVKVVYRLSETSIICRACLPNGQWSKYAHSSACNSSEAFFKPKLVDETTTTKNHCKSKDLDQEKDAEQDNIEFIKESIQSWDARIMLDMTLDTVPEYSMAVFTRRGQNSTLEKFCRRCLETQWEDDYSPCPIEFATPKCDPIKLRGVSYFVYVDDGSKLSRQEASNLVYPGQIAAVYEFGVQKYCKLCQSDGSWSSYPQFQLCDIIKW